MFSHQRLGVHVFLPTASHLALRTWWQHQVTTCQSMPPPGCHLWARLEITPQVRWTLHVMCMNVWNHPYTYIRCIHLHIHALTHIQTDAHTLKIQIKKSNRATSPTTAMSQCLSPVTLTSVQYAHVSNIHIHTYTHAYWYNTRAWMELFSTFHSLDCTILYCPHFIHT